MNFIYLNLFGTVFTLLFGVWAMVQPFKVSKFIALTPYNNRGTTEIRATYGGWMFGLAAFTLYHQSDLLFHCLGAGWVGAGVLRGISMFVLDDSYSKTNLYFFIFEIVMGIFLLL